MNDQLPSQLARERGLREVLRLQALKDYTAVVVTCSGLIEQYPDEAQLFFRLALARSALGEKEQAILDMTRAIDLFPGEPAYHYFRALWRTGCAALLDAAADFREVIRLEEQLDSVYYIDSARLGLAVACFLAGDHLQVRRILQNVSDDEELFVANRHWTVAVLRGGE